MTWLPHHKFVGTSQSCENAMANSQQHSSGTSRSAKRPRSNHEPQPDEAEGRSSRTALGATRRISAYDRRFGSAALFAHARVPNDPHSGFDWSDRRSGASTSQKVSACPDSPSKRSAFCFNLSRHGSRTPPTSESKRSIPALLPLSAPRPSPHRHLQNSLWRTCWSHHTSTPPSDLRSNVRLRALPRASQSGKAPLTLNNTGGERESQVVK